MKAFYHLLANTTVAAVTNFTVWFAITYFSYLETKSVLATSILGGLFLVFTAGSGFWFGSIVDHNRKKTAMMISSVTSLTIYIAAFALYVSVPDDAFSTVASPVLWTFAPLLLVGVIAGNIRNIAMTTAVTILVPEDKRDKANGLVGMSTGAAFMVVSVISGFLVGLAGMYYVLILAIALSAACIIHLLTVSVPEKEIVHTADKPKKLDMRGTIKVVYAIPGLFALIFFTTFNNFLGGVYMSLMDAYGLSLVSVQVWGLIWGCLSTAFIIGGIIISKFGLGKNPLRSMLLTNVVIWSVSAVFTIQPSIILLSVGMFIYLCVVPFIEASEHTIIQKVVPADRQGRVFGFAQSLEMSASPITAFLIGPIAQFIFIPFMTTGAGVELIGDWYGVGAGRGLAMVFSIAGVIGLTMTLIAMNSRYYKLLSKQYLTA
jgi:MFS transporter, DHA3 family, multidrug efflux protein